jgi:uncharacterized membrane protein
LDLLYKSKKGSIKERKRMKTFLIFLLAGATAALTIVVRIPIPGTGGYLNFGDVAVIFCGLFLGKKYGAIAGGVGSALADVIGGFFIFAPITLVAKGLEAFLAGLISERKTYLFQWQKIALYVISLFTILGISLRGRYIVNAIPTIEIHHIFGLLVDVALGIAIHLFIAMLLFKLINWLYFKSKDIEKKPNTNVTLLLLPLASLTMLIVYFIAELFLPGMGLAAALSEVPFNMIQVVVGAFGGYFVYVAVMKALPQKSDSK